MIPSKCTECDRFDEIHTSYADYSCCKIDKESYRVFRYMNYRDDPENRVCTWCPLKHCADGK